jgi:flagellar biosynthesis/type III secretory pathway protein FliH
MENNAERIIAAALENVKDSLADADAEIEQVLAKAKERGRRRGEEEGREISRRLEHLHTNLFQELRSEVLRSAVIVAREVLREETESNQEVVLLAALRAFATIKDARAVSLRVNQEDVTQLKSHKERLLDGLERAKEVDVRVDRRVARGGLIIQTESGIIDAQINTQLEEIATTLGV